MSINLVKIENIVYAYASMETEYVLTQWSFLPTTVIAEHENHQNISK
jgi:hypothetical protein